MSTQDTDRVRAELGEQDSYMGWPSVTCILNVIISKPLTIQILDSWSSFYVEGGFIPTSDVLNTLEFSYWNNFSTFRS